MNENEINYNADELKFPDEEGVSVGDTIINSTYNVEQETEQVEEPLPSPGDTLYTPKPSLDYKPFEKPYRKITDQDRLDNLDNKSRTEVVRYIGRQARRIRRNLDVIIILLQNILTLIIIFIGVMFGVYYNVSFSEATFEKLALIAGAVLAFLAKMGLDFGSIFVQKGRLLGNIKDEVDTGMTIDPSKL